MFGRQQIPEVIAADVPDGVFLLDVRDHDEWAAGHAESAHHLPMHEVPARIGEVPPDRDVVVVCRVGGRSAQVVAFLRAQGFERIVNLSGGMFAWQAAGRELVSDDGQVPRVL